MVGFKNQKEVAITNPAQTKTTEDANEAEGGVNEHERETWDNPCEFFLSCLGFAVGFGNVWRFPFLAFKNGGAVFLIPYIIMLLIAGLPMFFMELALGQYVSLGPNILFPELSPVFSGIGWSMMATTGMVTIYYNMIFAWSLFYTFGSFTSELAWSHCNNDFNSDRCFTYDQSLKCQNQSLYYYNKTCHGIDTFCDFDGFESHNETHCAIPNENNTIIPILASKAIKRVSSSEDYYKRRMLGITDDTTWENMGTLKWELVGCLALAWTIICLCMIKGVKSSGKVVYVTAIFPYIVLVILFIRGLTLPGAYEGIAFYILRPDFSKLYEIEVWNDAATQIFYSLSTAFGGLITLSSYNKFKNNCMRDAIIISFANCATSVFAGFVIFSILGFMANEIDVSVEDVVDSGSGLAFIAYPAAVARMPLPPLWSILFFTMLITLGLDSQFTFVETLSTGIFDKYNHLRKHKPLVMICLSTVMFILGLPLCMNGGVYMFELLNYYSAGLSVLFIAICEVVCVSYVYGFRRFMRNITDEMGIHVPKPLYIYWGTTWCFLTPLSLIIILVFAVIYFQPGQWGSYTYPDNIQTLGWFTTLFSMIFIPIFACYVIFVERKRGEELIRATEKFCPAYKRNKLAKVLNNGTSKPANGSFKYTYDNEAYVKGQGNDTNSAYEMTEGKPPSYEQHL